MRHYIKLQLGILDEEYRGRIFLPLLLGHVLELRVCKDDKRKNCIYLRQGELDSQ